MKNFNQKGATNSVLILSALVIILAGVVFYQILPQQIEPPPVQPTPNQSGQFIGSVKVDKIDVVVLKSNPLQVQVTAFGNFGDNCTTLSDIKKERQGNEFKIVITPQRTDAKNCGQNPVPFRETFSLDVYGLKAGTYQVDVNGIKGKFVFERDNTLGN